jgi:hypothetical protein
MGARYVNIEGAYVILEMPILKAHRSCRLSVFLPFDGRIAIGATAASVIGSVEPATGEKPRQGMIDLTNNII